MTILTPPYHHYKPKLEKNQDVFEKNLLLGLDNLLKVEYNKNQKGGGTMKLTLKKARLCAEKTQRDVAKHLGINVDTYRALERDPEKATIYQAKSLSAYFGIPYDEIFFCNSSTLSSETASNETKSA